MVVNPPPAAVDDPMAVGLHPDLEALRHHLGGALDAMGQRGYPER
jgi:hypothetical protein